MKVKEKQFYHKWPLHTLTSVLYIKQN